MGMGKFDRVNIWRYFKRGMNPQYILVHVHCPKHTETFTTLLVGFGFARARALVFLS
jgi:hypothetical protein